PLVTVEHPPGEVPLRLVHDASNVRHLPPPRYSRANGASPPDWRPNRPRILPEDGNPRRRKPFPSRNPAGRIAPARSLERAVGARHEEVAMSRRIRVPSAVL